MDVRKLKQRASEAMAVAREPKKVILVYTGVMLLLTLLVTVANVWLSSQISDTGGLANLGTRSVLSTIQTVLPLAQSLVLMCWELGYYSAVMRFARKQYADHTDLMTGFHRFGPLLRMSLLQGLIFLAIFLGSSYLGAQIFIFTPFARELTEAMTPLMESAVADPNAMLMDAAVLEATENAILPLLAIVGLIFTLFAVPVAYRYRMANYRLLDHPREGALAALRNSRAMMRGNCVSLFRLDLSFWWYYLLQILATALCYGDQLLPMLGVALPVSPRFAFFLFYGLYLAAQFGIHYCFRNFLEVTYVQVYEQIRPREKENAVVLGNIFQM